VRSLVHLCAVEIGGRRRLMIGGGGGDTPDPHVKPKQGGWGAEEGGEARAAAQAG
jgi:hypothetical protein